MPVRREFISYLILVVILSNVYSQKYARCILKENPDGVKGTVYFSQEDNNSAVRVSGDIEGFDKMVGFHIHERPITGNDCTTALGHFNPDNKEHGAPTDTNRHVGDLGNVSNEFEFTDPVISLYPVTGRNIIGRSCVFHSGLDDLGKGTNAESKITGNAGSRMACGNIDEYTSAKHIASGLIIMLLTILFMI